MSVTVLAMFSLLTRNVSCKRHPCIIIIIIDGTYEEAGHAQCQGESMIMAIKGLLYSTLLKKSVEK